MPFANVSDKVTGESNFKKTEFIDLPQGISIIRILEPSAYRTYVHYVKGVYVECLGEDCPVCKSNRQIILTNEDNFRNVPEYSSKVERHVVNVLDRTSAKICPNCKKEHKKIDQSFPSSCSCGQILMSVQDQPINKVKILAKGKELFAQLNVLEQSVLDSNREPLGLTSFDISLFVQGAGRNTKITAVPLVTSNDKVEVEADKLFDKEKVTFKLSEAEILDVMRGVQLRDILVARKADKADTFIKEEASTLSAQVEETVNELFNN